MSKAEVIDKYGLQPHPEGGYYREVYRSSDRVMLKRGERSSMTNIYYLLGANEFSAWHRILSDETWAHLQGGADLRIHMINEKGDYSQCILGKSCEQAEPLFTVPPRVWFAAETVQQEGQQDGDEHYSLVSCIVAPGFYWEDFTMGDRAELLAQFSSQSDIITRLTREVSVTE